VVTVSTAGPQYDQTTPKLKNVTNVMCGKLVARIHAINIIWVADQKQTVNDGSRKQGSQQPAEKDGFVWCHSCLRL
jgi:hypothetical protein